VAQTNNNYQPGPFRLVACVQPLEWPGQELEATKAVMLTVPVLATVPVTLGTLPGGTTSLSATVESQKLPVMLVGRMLVTA
jgi:hypothetical protein